MKDRFDLENEIMGCWRVTEDLQHLLEHIDKGVFSSLSSSDTDDLANIIMGLKHIYDMKFQVMFDTFGECLTPEPYKVRLNDVAPEEWDQVSKRFYQDPK